MKALAVALALFVSPVLAGGENPFEGPGMSEEGAQSCSIWLDNHDYLARPMTDLGRRQNALVRGFVSHSGMVYHRDVEEFASHTALQLDRYCHTHAAEALDTAAISAMLIVFSWWP